MKSEEIFHFSVYFHGAEIKYLNGRGSGCKSIGPQSHVGFLIPSYA